MKNINQSQVVRKLGLFLLTGIIAVSITACGTTPTPSTTPTSSEDDSDRTIHTENATYIEDFETLVKEVEAHLVVSSDGLLELGVTADGVTPTLSKEAQELFDLSQENLNKLILNDEAVLNDEFAVADISGDIAADAWAFTYRWWGGYFTEYRNNLWRANVGTAMINAGLGLLVRGRGGYWSNISRNMRQFDSCRNQMYRLNDYYGRFSFTWSGRVYCRYTW